MKVISESSTSDNNNKVMSEKEMISLLNKKIIVSYK